MTYLQSLTTPVDEENKECAHEEGLSEETEKRLECFRPVLNKFPSGIDGLQEFTSLLQQLLLGSVKTKPEVKLLSKRLPPPPVEEFQEDSKNSEPEPAVEPKVEPEKETAAKPQAAPGIETDPEVLKQKRIEVVKVLAELFATEGSYFQGVKNFLDDYDSTKPKTPKNPREKIDSKRKLLMELGMGEEKGIPSLRAVNNDTSALLVDMEKQLAAVESPPAGKDESYFSRLEKIRTQKPEQFDAVVIGILDQFQAHLKSSQEFNASYLVSFDRYNKNALLLKQDTILRKLKEENGKWFNIWSPNIIKPVQKGPSRELLMADLAKKVTGIKELSEKANSLTAKAKSFNLVSQLSIETDQLTQFLHQIEYDQTRLLIDRNEVLRIINEALRMPNLHNTQKEELNQLKSLAESHHYESKPMLKKLRNTLKYMMLQNRQELAAAKRALAQ